jgi:hypothetical protein
MEPGLLGGLVQVQGKGLEWDDLEREEWEAPEQERGQSESALVPNVEQLLPTLQVSLAPSRPVQNAAQAW